MNRKTTLVLRMVPVGLLASTIMLAGCVAPAVGGAGAAAFNRGTGSADRADEVRAAAVTLTRSGRDDWYLVAKPASPISGGLSPDERGAAPETISRHPRHRASGAPDASFPKTAIPR